MFSAGLLFLKRPVILFLYTIGLLGILGFIFVIFFGYLRHHGHLFILLITCLWMKAFYRESDVTLHEFLEKRYDWLKRNANRLFLLLLFVQILAGLYAFTVQLIIPFSAGKETARYIRQEKSDRFLIAGDQDISLETVSSYLDQEVFYFSRKCNQCF